ncbi:MAG: hypothetical protein ABS92_10120 [Thiobacillus sp. SCN 63-374]|nr:MAG: hypothetical protein ABS92_10120 [Thiobacillus sp. SCN 63-374]
MTKELIKSDATIKATKPQAVPYRLSDGSGLYLLVRPDGKKWWRLDYTHEGKRKTLSLGTYPDTGLALARTKAAKERELVADEYRAMGYCVEARCEISEISEISAVAMTCP